MPILLNNVHVISMIVMGTNKIPQISPVNQNMSPMNSREGEDSDS